MWIKYVNPFPRYCAKSLENDGRSPPILLEWKSYFRPYTYGRMRNFVKISLTTAELFRFEDYFQYDGFDLKFDLNLSKSKVDNFLLSGQ